MTTVPSSLAVAAASQTVGLRDVLFLLAYEDYIEEADACLGLCKETREDVLLNSALANEGFGDWERTRFMASCATKAGLDRVKWWVETCGAKVNQETSGGWTPLMYACEVEPSNDQEDDACAAVVRYLLDHGADLNKSTYNGRNALLQASNAGSAKTVQLLLDVGADVDSEDANGWTPLMCATSSGHTKVVKLLIAAGADVNANNNNGKSVAAIAKGSRHEHILQLLYDAGAAFSHPFSRGISTTTTTSTMTTMTILMGRIRMTGTRSTSGAMVKGVDGIRLGRDERVSLRKLVQTAQRFTSLRQEREGKKIVRV
jgi:hypothetical protein